VQTCALPISSLPDWTTSVTTAMEELEALSAADRFVILSVRAGTLICSQANLHGFTVSRHFCLDPVLDGNQYAAALNQAQAQMLADPMRFQSPRVAPANPAFTEWMGNQYSHAFVADLQKLQLDPGL